MFCISNKNFKFLGCADLTIMTVIMGSLIAGNALLILFFGDGNIWAMLSIYSLLFGISCYSVYFYRHSIALRVVLLVMYAVEVLLYLAYAGLFIYAIVWLNNEFEPDSNVMSFLIMRFNIFATVRIIFLTILGFVLVGGLKQQ